MVEQEIKLLENFDRDGDWFHENLNYLIEKFTGKFVAIKEGQVIASEDSMDKLSDSLESKKENPSLLFIEFVHPAGVTILF